MVKRGRVGCQFGSVSRPSVHPMFVPLANPSLPHFRGSSLPRRLPSNAPLNHCPLSPPVPLLTLITTASSAASPSLSNYQLERIMDGRTDSQIGIMGQGYPALPHRKSVVPPPVIWVHMHSFPNSPHPSHLSIPLFPPAA